MTQLSLFSVCKKFLHYNEERTIFSNLNYVFDQKKTYAIMGPSGSGKSTLLHLLAGIDTPTSGTILLNNITVNSLNGYDRAQNIALVIQSSHFINELTVHENSALPGLATNQTITSCLKKSAELLAAVGLESYASYPIGALSGGQRQRLALVCALMNNPTFLIADEVTGNLDQATAHIIMKLLVELHKKQQCGIILTTHDPGIASYMDTILYLKPDGLVPLEKDSFTTKAIS
jgi:ABC-type lipoprotein export system ATPase subunit